MAEHSHLPTAAVEGDTSIIRYVNQAFCDLAKRKAEDLIGVPLDQVVAEAGACLPRIESVYRTGRGETCVVEERTEGIYRFLSLAMWPIYRGNGRPRAAMIQVADATEEERARQRTIEMNRQLMLGSVRQHELVEEASHERDRLLTLINSMADGVWFTDKEGRVLLANAVARSQAQETGLDPDSLSESHPLSILSQVEMLTPDQKRLDMEPLFQVFQGKAFREVEIAVRNKTTGEVFHRRISANPILDSEKRVEAVVVVVRDTTSEKRAEVEKARLEEHLRQAQKMEAIGTLAGGIAHDFNNMLAVIIGNAELAEDDVDEHGRHNIKQILKASKRARDLVKQILTYSRKAGTGKNAIELTPLVKETSKLFRGTLPSTIRIDLKAQTEQDTILADQGQIQQVMMNLATNAAYAMRDKGGVLTIGLTNVSVTEDNKPALDLEPGKYVKLRIRDTGTGMTKEIMERIFDPFFTTKEAGEGTGMGLAVVYGIVKSHNGGVTVESRPGKGTTFNVFFPCVAAHATEQQEEKEGVAPRGKEHILVVDDEESLVEAVSNILERLGYRVTTALNPSQAWKIFEKDPHSFDLVITDQTMPGLTGIELAKRMLSARKDLPIILFTGYSETVSPEKAKSVGISEFVMKPVVKREVAETVRRVLDKKK